MSFLIFYDIIKTNFHFQGNKMQKDPFKEYIKQLEPSKRERGYAWQTAIGLQDVDGLKPSPYLLDTAVKNIEGDITLDQAQDLVNCYYEENEKADLNSRTKEADQVSVRIAKILSQKAFSFTTNEYIALHKKLFTNIYEHAGRVRDYNITKKEWVLNGETVIYGTASEINATLNYDIQEEKKFNYQGLSQDEIINHLAQFVSSLWQIHAFCEGNTRTTAVFFIKYLRTLGFNVTNDIFAKHAWYFRNALVRANFNDLKNGIYATVEFLELFLKNLLLGENHLLSNRLLHVDAPVNLNAHKSRGKGHIGKSKVDIHGEKVDIDGSKVDIDGSKVDIHREKVDIGGKKAQPEHETKCQLSLKDNFEKSVKSSLAHMKGKSLQNILKIHEYFQDKPYFGRPEVADLLKLKPAMASRILKTLVDHHLITPVKGHGKGKYRFFEE